MKKPKLIEGWKEKIADARWLCLVCACDQEIPCPKRTSARDFIHSLLQQQAELTRKETIEECRKIIKAVGIRPVPDEMHALVQAEILKSLNNS